MSEGEYNIKGGKMGLWKFFNENGVLTEEGNYEDDLAIGEHKSYHVINGKVSSISQFDAGNLTGYYQAYHVNGKLQTQIHNYLYVNHKFSLNFESV